MNEFEPDKIAKRRDDYGLIKKGADDISINLQYPAWFQDKAHRKENRD
jgi:hypothetical protein